jgi:hypothetical protein
MVKPSLETFKPKTQTLNPESQFPSPAGPFKKIKGIVSVSRDYSL